MKYYNVSRYWTDKFEPHLNDEKLKKILVTDFNKFTWGRWREKFTCGDYPCDFESCDWAMDHRGRWPRYWRYTKYSACHWLVNFTLRLANLAEPKRPWRIITSDKHSTVWDGKLTVLDFTFQAMKIDPQECFDLAHDRELPVGKYLKVYYAQHYSVEQSEIVACTSS